MKTLTPFIVALCSALIFSSCEKQIELNLDESAQKYVVEGIVHDSLGDNYVLISKTRPYGENGNIEQITNAQVKINDNYGNTYNLYEVAPGYYTDSTLQGIANRTYDLVINVDGKTITAQSDLNARVNIDSLSQEETTAAFWEDPNIPEYRARCHFTDPLNVLNFYRLKAFKGGEQENGFMALDDRFFDGKATSFPIFESKFYKGDTVTIQLLSIDEVNYRYLVALASSQGGQVPGNPITNLNSDDAVGYFGAFAKSQQTIIIE